MKLLLIEDDDADAQIAIRAITGAQPGAELHHVSTIEAAVAALERGGFAGVLVDLTLPPYAGLEVVERLAPALRGAGVPCVVLTGLDEQALQLLRRPLVRAGADAILIKPSTGFQMAATMEEAIERANREQARGPALVASAVADVGRAIAADIEELRVGIGTSDTTRRAELEAMAARVEAAGAGIQGALEGLVAKMAEAETGAASRQSGLEALAAAVDAIGLKVDAVTETLQSPGNGENPTSLDAEEEVVEPTTEASAQPGGGWIVALGETWTALTPVNQRSAIGGILAILATIGSLIAAWTGNPFTPAATTPPPVEEPAPGAVVPRPEPEAGMEVNGAEPLEP